MWKRLFVNAFVIKASLCKERRVRVKASVCKQICVQKGVCVLKRLCVKAICE